MPLTSPNLAARQAPGRAPGRGVGTDLALLGGGALAGRAGTTAQPNRMSDEFSSMWHGIRAGGCWHAWHDSRAWDLCREPALSVNGGRRRGPRRPRHGAAALACDQTPSMPISACRDRPAIRPSWTPLPPPPCRLGAEESASLLAQVPVSGALSVRQRHAARRVPLPGRRAQPVIVCTCVFRPGDLAGGSSTPVKQGQARLGGHLPCRMSLLIMPPSRKE